MNSPPKRWTVKISLKRSMGDINVLTNATRLTMLMLKLTFSSSVTRGVRSIRGIVNNQADTYMMGADRNVLITIPDVTSKRTERKH